MNRKDVKEKCLILGAHLNIFHFNCLSNELPVSIILIKYFKVNNNESLIDVNVDLGFRCLFPPQTSVYL